MFEENYIFPNEVRKSKKYKKKENKKYPYKRNRKNKN